MRLAKDPALFRDLSGRVYELDGRILRTVTSHAVVNYEYVRDSDALNKFTKNGWIIEAKEIDKNILFEKCEDLCYVIEHPQLPFISYPYEWCFVMLKDAALLHLDLQLSVLKHNVTLSDASAYNVQFRGASPIFIDYLSFRKYQDGEFWLGHRQFCEQFLNPLLLRAYLGISHNHWFRGSLEGISINDMNRLLPLYRKFSWRVFTHITLPARLQKLYVVSPYGATRPISSFVNDALLSPALPLFFNFGISVWVMIFCITASSNTRSKAAL